MKAALRRELSRQWRRCRFLAHQKVLAGSPTCLTCFGRRDGGGAQWHAAISVLAFARAYGLVYLHTPFHSVEHGPPASATWLRAWNGLFDLADVGISTTSGRAPLLPCPDPLTLLRQRWFCALPADAVLCMEHAHAFTNLFAVDVAALRPLLRQAYRPGSFPVAPPLPLHRALVVHVRRGDVQAGGHHSHRFTSAESIAVRCREVQARHPQLQHVLLLSASPDPDLLALRRQGFVLDYQQSVFTHLHWMSQAGGFVMAKSSLSYLAAMLNPNLVFYELFEHPPLPGWECYPSNRLSINL